MLNHKTILNSLNTEITELQKKLTEFINSDTLGSEDHNILVELINNGIRTLDHAVEKISALK